MKKKKSRLPSVKNSTLTALIGILLLTLLKLVEPLIPTATTKSTLPSSEHPIELYANQAGDDLTKLYVDTIQSAKQSIAIAIYSLKNPEIIDALKGSCLEGKQVSIVCDAQASKGITKHFAGKSIQIVRRAGEGLTHQKIVVIDDERVLLGSSNFTTESLAVHGNLVLGLENTALATSLSKKIKSMDEDTKSTPLLHQNAMIGSQEVELWVLPDDPQAAQRLKSLIQAAKKTLRVAMFTWTRQDLAEEAIKAHKRGIHVEAIIDRYSGNGASAKVVKALSGAGIPVRLSTSKGLMHHKFAIIDDEILVNGSANWTLNAFKSNDDCFLILHDLTTDQQKKLNEVWSVLSAQSEKAVK